MSAFMAAFNEANELMACSTMFKNEGLLAMITEPARKTSLENKHLRNRDYFALIPSSVFAFYNVNEETCNWISLSAVKVNTQN